MGNSIGKHLRIPPDLHERIMKRAATHQPFKGVLEDLLNDVVTQGQVIARHSEIQEKLEDDKRKLSRDIEDLKAELKISEDSKKLFLRKLSKYEDTTAWEI